MKPFFLGRRWINNQRKSNSVWYNTLHWKIIALICCARTKRHLNNRICQHCGVKTSTVTLSFYYVFNISLSFNINIPSFIGNLWWDLLLGNHLKKRNHSWTSFSLVDNWACTPGFSRLTEVTKCEIVEVIRLSDLPLLAWRDQKREADQWNITISYCSWKCTSKLYFARFC